VTPEELGANVETIAEGWPICPPPTPEQVAALRALLDYADEVAR
jgi:hypothetical protein